MSENSTNEGPQINVDMSAAEAQRKRRIAHGRAFIERRIETLLAEAAVLAAEYDVSQALFEMAATTAWHHEKDALASARCLALHEVEEEHKADDK